MKKFHTVALLLLLVLLNGCGESTKDTMLRMAEQRAVRNRADLEAAEAAEAAAATAVAATPAPAPVPAPANDPPPSPAAPDPAAVADEAITSPQPPPDIAPAAVDPAETAPPEAVLLADGAATASPATDALLGKKIWISPDGRLAASIASDDAIEVFDIASKKSLRRFFTPDLKPVSLAFAGSDRLVVGTQTGGIKEYALTEVEGLDEFSKKRQLRLEAVPAVKIHEHPVSALAMGSKFGISGDTSGELRFWNANRLPNQSLSGLKSPAKHFQAFQNDRVIFAASEDGTINFWQRSADGATVSAMLPYGRLSSMPIAMRTLPDGKGLAVVDDKGVLFLSVPRGDKVTTSTHQLPGGDPVNVAFARNGQSLVIAMRDGRIVEQTLPFPDAKSFAVGGQQPRFFTTVGERLLVATDDKTIDVFSKTGQPLKRIKMKDASTIVTAATLSADGNWLITGDQTGRLSFINFATEAVAATIQVAKDPISRLNQPGSKGDLLFSSLAGDLGCVAFPWQKGFSATAPIVLAHRVLCFDPKLGIVSLNAAGDTLSFNPLSSDQKPISRSLGQRRVASAEFSPEGILLGCLDGELLLWDVAAADFRSLGNAPSGHSILAAGQAAGGELLAVDNQGLISKRLQTDAAISPSMVDPKPIRVVASANAVAWLDADRQLWLASSDAAATRIEQEENGFDQIGFVASDRLLAMQSGSKAVYAFDLAGAVSGKLELPNACTRMIVSAQSGHSVFATTDGKLYLSQSGLQAPQLIEWNAKQSDSDQTAAASVPEQIALDATGEVLWIAAGGRLGFFDLSQITAPQTMATPNNDNPSAGDSLTADATDGHASTQGETQPAPKQLAVDLVDIPWPVGSLPLKNLLPIGKGLFVLDAQGKLTWLATSTSPPAPVAGVDQVGQVYSGAGGNILAITDGGLVRLDASSEKMSSFVTQALKSDGSVIKVTKDNLVDASADGNLGWRLFLSDGTLAHTAEGAASSDGWITLANFKTAIGEADVHNGRMAVVSGNSLAVLDANARRTTQVRTNGPAIVHFALSATGQPAVVDSEGKLWTAGSQAAVPLPGGEPAIDVCWADSANTVVASAYSVYLWNAETGSFASRVDVTSEVDRVLGYDGNQALVHCTNGMFQHIAMPTLKWHMLEKGGMQAFVADADKRRIVCSGPAKQLWNIDLDSGNVLNQIDCGEAGCDELLVQSSQQRVLVVGQQSQLSAYTFGESLVSLPGEDRLTRHSFVADPTSDRLFAINPQGKVDVYDSNTGVWAPMASTAAISDLAGLDAKTLVGLSITSPEMQLIPTGSGQRQIHIATQGILSFDWAATDRVCAYVDGSAELHLLSAVSAELTKDITIANSRLMETRVDPAGQNVVVAGQRVSGEYFLGFWQVEDGAFLRDATLEKPIQFMDFSPDGSRLGAVTEDGAIHVYSADGIPLQSTAPGSCDSNFAFNTDASSLIYSQKSEVIMHPLTTLSAIEVAQTPITKIIDVPDSPDVICATAASLLLTSPATDGERLAFEGLPGSLVDACTSPDGKLLAGLNDLASGGKVALWELARAPDGGKSLSASQSISGEQPASAIAFSNDSKFLLLGGQDGTIRAWSLADNREVARFVGSEGMIVEIESKSDGARFVSLAADKSLRSWTFPAKLPGPGDPIPDGALTASTDLLPSTSPEVSRELLDEDPMDTARRALFSGSGRAEAEKRFFSELSGDIQLKEAARASYAELNRLQSQMLNGEQVDPAALASARKNFSKARRELLPLTDAVNSTSLADDHPNLLYSANTQFVFGGLRNAASPFRPVKLRLSGDRFVYASRASEQKPEEQEDGGSNQELEPGYVMSWDFGYSGIQAYAWTFPELQLNDVYSSPNNDGIFTGPNLAMFADDGSSRVIANNARCWAVSPDSLSTRERLMAVGKWGPANGEGPVLQVYRTTALASQSAEPISSFAAFEGVVTSIAFGNRHPRIAFSLRDRTSTKVFIADPLTLAAESFRLVYQHNHTVPFHGSRVPVAGFTSMAFSPNDDVLVAHGHFDTTPTTEDDSGQSEYRFSGWIVEWNDAEVVKTSSAFEDFTSRTTLIDDNSPLSLRFLEGVDFSLPNYQRMVSQGSRKSRTGKSVPSSSVGDLQVIFERGGEADVYSLLKSEVITTVNLGDTQRGKASYSVTQDGRWLIVGDGLGNVNIWDLANDKKYPLTLNERPAHTGPVVGVVLSEVNPKLGIPEFAATAGEENQVKVWDLISVLQPAVEAQK